MSMMRLEKTVSPQAARLNPFHKFICDSCGRTMGRHWLFRPDKLADVFRLTEQGRKPDGKFYCWRDQVGWAKSYHQRQLRRTMEAGYAGRT